MLDRSQSFLHPKTSNDGCVHVWSIDFPQVSLEAKDDQLIGHFVQSKCSNRTLEIALSSYTMINNDRRAIPTVKISAVHPICEEQFQTIEIRFIDRETFKHRQENSLSSKEMSNSDPSRNSSIPWSIIGDNSHSRENLVSHLQSRIGENVKNNHKTILTAHQRWSFGFSQDQSKTKMSIWDIQILEQKLFLHQS